MSCVPPYSIHYSIRRYGVSATTTDSDVIYVAEGVSPSNVVSPVWIYGDY